MTSISYTSSSLGFSAADWVSICMTTDQTRLENLQRDKSQNLTAKTTIASTKAKFTSLRSSIEKLTDGRLGASFDIFSKRNTTTTDAGIATATASNGTSTQSLDLIVNNLATATVAKGATAPGAGISTSSVLTDIANNSLKAGQFSIYVDNKQYKYQIADNADKKDKDGNVIPDAVYTMQELIDKINNDFSENSEVTASITPDGKFSLDVANGVDTRLGATSDTSNFIAAMQLKKNATTGDYLSENAITSIDTDANLIGNDAHLNTAVVAGSKFKIGGEEFEIKADTSLSDIISKINTSDAGVTASYEARTNSFKLTAKNPGQTTIDMEETSGNFLKAMGLVDADGNILAGTQTLGKNASVSINGQTIEAATNTITSDISGISGLTLVLNAESTATTEKGKTVKIGVTQNSDDVVNAVNDFISKFNATISQIDSVTGDGAALDSDYSLIRIRQTLRQSATAADGTKNAYDSLGVIGISTGSVGQSAGTVTSSLSLDKSKFLKALTDNPDQVRSLLIGDSSNGTTGILGRMKDLAVKELDPTNGYFAAKSESLNSLGSTIDRTISAQQLRMEDMKVRLTAQFSSMDTAISRMQSQYGSL